jgi:hypothetical protein
MINLADFLLGVAFGVVAAVLFEIYKAWWRDMQ